MEYIEKFQPLISNCQWNFSTRSEIPGVVESRAGTICFYHCFSSSCKHTPGKWNNGKLILHITSHTRWASRTVTEEFARYDLHRNFWFAFTLFSGRKTYIFCHIAVGNTFTWWKRTTEKWDLFYEGSVTETIRRNKAGCKRFYNML